MAAASDRFSCFNRRGHPRGHFYSANDLFKMGVWVGYLSSEKHGVPFKDLPSFNDLKKNFKKFSPPYPPPESGMAREERYAVCRGCLGDTSQLISLQEMQFFGKTKLTIMGLDGTDDAGMFCILLPQSNDRSLQGLKAFRPYEFRNGGQGKTFASDIVLLTLRNTSQSSGTLETVRAVLGVPEPKDSDREGADDLSNKSQQDSTRKSAPKRSISGRFVKATHRSSSQEQSPHNERASKKRKLSDSSNELSSEHQDTKTTMPQAQQPSDGSRESTLGPAGADHATPLSKGSAVLKTPSNDDKNSFVVVSSSVIPLDLTEEQSKRIRLSWTVTVDEVEYDFTHSLTNCETFSDYLNLLRDDSADDPEVLAIVENSKVWRLTYQLPDTPKKAFTIRVGEETGFERFQQALAQASFWHDYPAAKVDVALRALK